MLQLLILCLYALQPVVLVLLGERRRHQQHGIRGEHHASQAEKTTAFPFLISVFLFRLFLSVFFNRLLFSQSRKRKDTTASIHGRDAHIEHPLYRRTIVLLLPPFLLLSSSPLSCSVLTQRTSGPLLPLSARRHGSMVSLDPDLLVEGFVSDECFPGLSELHAGLPADLQLLSNRDLLQ